jgi:hypothetical protein
VAEQFFLAVVRHAVGDGTLAQTKGSYRLSGEWKKKQIKSKKDKENVGSTKKSKSKASKVRLKR